MPRPRRLAVALASLALSAVGCDVAQRPDESAGAAGPSSLVTSPPPATPQPTSAPAEFLLFEDDFSDAESGWHRESTEEQRAAGLELGYRDGQYRIAITPGVKLTYSVPAPAGETAEAVRITVDMQRSGLPAFAGVYCRSDEANEDFYIFTIDTDGFHAIGKVVDGEPSRLWAGIEPSPAIRGPGEVNSLGAECIGRAGSVLLRLSVNGEQLLEHEDPEPIEGSDHGIYGLFVETTSAGDVELWFDNYRSMAIPEMP